MKGSWKYMVCTLLAIGVAIAYTEWRMKDKSVVVDLKTMFDQFDMKKEYEKKMNTVRQARQRGLDSLALQLKMMTSKSETLTKDELLAAKELRVQFLTKEREIEQANMQLTAEYDKEIISRMLLYAKEFSKANGYQIVYGNDGNGTILYNNENTDVTKALVDYINNSYSGKK
jgi:Skp family chaperone for outer membrane proteins